jgi:hypothetical protein
MLKQVKLYSLEAVIDNSLFKNYSTINATSYEKYLTLYKLQRDFDLMAFP